MLVLMQREGEAVIIYLPDGRTVGVRLVAVERGRARIGYAADRDIQIDREGKARVPAEQTREREGAFELSYDRALDKLVMARTFMTLEAQHAFDEEWARHMHGLTGN